MNALQYIAATVEPVTRKPVAFEFNVLVPESWTQHYTDDDQRDADEQRDIRSALAHKAELMGILRKHTQGLHVDPDDDLGGPSEPEHGGPAMYWFAASAVCSPGQGAALAAELERWYHSKRIPFDRKAFLESFKQAVRHHDGTLVTGTVEPVFDTGDQVDAFWRALQSKLKVKHIEYGMFDNKVGRWVHDGSEPHPVSFRGSKPIDLRQGTKHQVSLVVVGGRIESVHYSATGFRMPSVTASTQFTSIVQAVRWVAEHVRTTPVTATVEPQPGIPEFKNGMDCDCVMYAVVDLVKKLGIRPDPEDRLIRPNGPEYVTRAPHGTQGLRICLEFKKEGGDVAAVLELVSDHEDPKSCTLRLCGGHRKSDWRASQVNRQRAEVHELTNSRKSWNTLVSGLKRCAAMQNRVGISAVVFP